MPTKRKNKTRPKWLEDYPDLESMIKITIWLLVGTIFIIVFISL